jgi:exonuclease VII small subunit
MVLQPGLVPDDARVLAWYNLKQLRGILEDGLKQHQRGLDTSTRAHLEEARDRVLKTLQAQLNAQ